MFFWCFLVYGFLGVFIIPKWLINDFGHIPILFGSFLELPNKSPNLDLSTPLFIKNLNILDFQDCVNFGKDGRRKLMKNRLIRFQKSWIRDQYLSTSMNGFFLIWYRYLLQNTKRNLGIWEFGKLSDIKNIKHEFTNTYF